MQLDSKESDIEQLREKLNDLQQRMDNSSVTSLQTDETDSNVAGRVSTGFQRWTLAPLFLCTETQLMEMLIPILQHWKSLFEEQKGCSNKAKVLLVSDNYISLFGQCPLTSMKMGGYVIKTTSN